MEYSVGELVDRLVIDRIKLHLLETDGEEGSRRDHLRARIHVVEHALQGRVPQVTALLDAVIGLVLENRFIFQCVETVQNAEDDALVARSARHAQEHNLARVGWINEINGLLDEQALPEVKL